MTLRRSTVFALALLIAASTRGEQCTLQLASSFAVGAAPQSVAAADLNGDGNIDLAVAGAVNVATYLGDGRGAFVPGWSFTSASFFDEVVIADVNADGKPDLAAVSELRGLTIMLGRGDGTFADPRFYAVVGQAIALAVGDVSADGKLDAVLANFGGNALTFLLGDGAGGFSAPQNLDLGNAQPQSLAIADFNRDGRLDVVVSAVGVAEIGFVLIGSDGNFTPATLPINWPSYILIATDVDGDGVTDVAMTTYSGSWASVFRGTSAGTFGAVMDNRGGSANGIAAGDFDGDGKRDLVVSDANENRLVLLPGVGDGTFGAATFVRSEARPQGIVAADFNGDGRPDVASANRLANNVSVFIDSCAGPRRRAVRR